MSIVGAGIAGAAPPKGKEERAFRQRLAALKKDSMNLFVVKMGPKDDPMAVPEPIPGSGTVLVAHRRSGFYTPPLLSPDDIRTVVNQNIVDVRKCYKKQLAEDPEWSEELILDLAIKKTGRVAEVSIAPRRVKRATVGECLMSAVPKWKFPEFTGETDEGIVQEVVNASFPFQLSPP